MVSFHDLTGAVDADRGAMRDLLAALVASKATPSSAAVKKSALVFFHTLFLDQTRFSCVQLDWFRFVSLVSFVVIQRRYRSPKTAVAGER
jgi:hypothetical protein